ncbi:hypothetical protein LM80661_200308 [Listeria monocytogenes]|nr:hypothetical protein LMQOC1_40028 [Listeria monocytogenes QOC1]CUK50839.1 hypothetical protein LM57179_160028 [Listeria monocytogenes]CUK72709.1 hypothetical protein LM601244_60050 [Listeria monocytogenes]CUL12311.1 hypothetical protein LM701377_180028 [Listeria monocytogenes]CUL22784.1 hypothetical protein LM7416_110052 [Listeria monocytogenes]
MANKKAPQESGAVKLIYHRFVKLIFQREFLLTLSQQICRIGSSAIRLYHFPVACSVRV